MEIKIIEHLLDEPEEMALCPLCDNVIMEGEPVAIGKAYGAFSLIHDFCYEEVEDD